MPDGEENYPYYEKWCYGRIWGCLSMSIRNKQLYVRNMEFGPGSRHNAMLSLWYRMWIKFKGVLPDVDIQIDIEDGPLDLRKGYEEHFGIFAF